MTAYEFKAGQSLAGIGYEEEIAQTLNGQMSGLEPTVFVKAKRASSPTDDESWVPGEVSPTIKVGTGLGIASPPAAMTQTAVRRLTPTECERLMGWPDDHTRWRADGTELADSTRYRMCGNGVASPVAEWLADMINQALENE